MAGAGGLGRAVSARGRRRDDACDLPEDTMTANSSASARPAGVPAPSTLGLEPSFGFGDRTGLATPGHVASLQRAGGAIRPIFAQQSIREMPRPSRTPPQVMADALHGMQQMGYTGKHGADADHLKVPEDVDATAD